MSKKFYKKLDMIRYKNGKNENLLKTIKIDDVSKKYVDWLNDYNVTKYTEQRYFLHTSESVSDFVSRKYNSENDLLFGIFLEKLHIGNFKLGPIIGSI